MMIHTNSQSSFSAVTFLLHIVPFESIRNLLSSNGGGTPKCFVHSPGQCSSSRCDLDSGGLLGIPQAVCPLVSLSCSVDDTVRISAIIGA